MGQYDHNHYFAHAVACDVDHSIYSDCPYDNDDNYDQDLVHAIEYDVDHGVCTDVSLDEAYDDDTDGAYLDVHTTVVCLDEDVNDDEDDSIIDAMKSCAHRLHIGKKEARKDLSRQRKGKKGSVTDSVADLS